MLLPDEQAMQQRCEEPFTLRMEVSPAGEEVVRNLTDKFSQSRLDVKLLLERVAALRHTLERIEAATQLPVLRNEQTLDDICRLASAALQPPRKGEGG